MERELDRISKKLDRIDAKLESFCAQQIKNTNDLLWIKRVGIVLVTIISFLGTQLYLKITENKQPVPAVLFNPHKENKNEEILRTKST